MAAANGALAVQDLASLDVTKLTPLSPEVISRQATINIGACVAHERVAVRGAPSVLAHERVALAPVLAPLHLHGLGTHEQPWLRGVRRSAAWRQTVSADH